MAHISCWRLSSIKRFFLSSNVHFVICSASVMGSKEEFVSVEKLVLLRV